MPRRLIVVIIIFIRSVHSACQKQFSDICDLGEFRRFIIPPYSVKTTGKITESKKTKANTNPVMRTQSMKQRTISEVSKCLNSFEIFHKYSINFVTNLQRYNDNRDIFLIIGCWAIIKRKASVRGFLAKYHLKDVPMATSHCYWKSQVG